MGADGQRSPGIHGSVTVEMVSKGKGLGNAQCVFLFHGGCCFCFVFFGPSPGTGLALVGGWLVGRSVGWLVGWRLGRTKVWNGFRIGLGRQRFGVGLG